MKKYLVSLLVGLGLLLLTLWYTWPDQDVHLVFCDVGQGDAILMWQGFTQVLVDTGRSDAKVLECLAEYVPFWDRQLELAVLTHADGDHIGGFSAISDRYGLSYLLVEPIGKKTDDFLEFHEAVSRKLEQGSRWLWPQFGQQLTVGRRLSLLTLSPRESSRPTTVPNATLTETQLWDALLTDQPVVTSYNDRSIVLLARIGEIEILLTGDLEHEGEQALLTQGLLSRVEVLKVGHHGSKTSTSDGLLQTARPEIAIVSSGKNNQYGHPAPDIIKKLEQSGAIILRTDEEGSIHLVTDGEKLWQK